jgi:alkylation response protein AidB-like acyl-CoA dehydrogenase
MHYLDLNINLTEDDMDLRNGAHEFAERVMRPIAKELDEMSPEAVVARESPLWDFMKQAFELGYHKILIPESYGGMDLTSLQQTILYEELSWGSFGLTVLLAVNAFPAFMACMAPNEDLINDIIVPYCECQDGSIRGCWAITEPDHGTDTLLPHHPSFHVPMKAQCRARLDGDEWVISGQKSAWVSGGTIATHAALFCQIDPSMGFAGGGIAVVPLNQPGVSRGKPLNKMGQRDLNQGEIFFDEARIPKSYMIVEPEAYEAMLEMTLSATTALMGILATGVARAAFEESIDYAKKRAQGGKILIEYPSIQMKLFHMFTKVETTRQISRAAYIFNQNTSTPAEEYSIAAKVHGTQAAFDVTNEAIQLFGGNGLSKEYLIEKLFRDARAGMIEDGSNESLAIGGGHKVIDTYPRLP